jgi:phosphate transport system substrate-binding protein
MLKVTFMNIDRKLKIKGLFFFLLISLSLVSCETENEGHFKIEDLTEENYPLVDGSTSTMPLQIIMACKLLDIGYSWQANLVWDGVYNVFPDRSIDINYHQGTHSAFINLIDKKADFILVARKASKDEMDHANEQAVSIIEVPVALDAFVFIVHPDNPVKSLTIKQIQDIYMGNITNWKEVGGKDTKIEPFIRDANSGSQELMESLVMKDLEMPYFPEAVLSGMMGPFSEVSWNVNGLCYTVYYYKEKMVRGNMVKQLSVDGIYPEPATIKSKKYPFTAEVYMAIRADTDRESMAYKLFELMQGKEGQRVVKESGYVPVK